MELIKNNIHMNRIEKKETVTFTLNKQCVITEANPRIDEIIGHKDFVTLDRVVIRNGQLYINGSVLLSLLYSSEDCDIAWGIEEEISFEENIRSLGLEDDCNVDVQVMIMSDSLKVIDERTYIYKAQLMAYITIEKIRDLEVLDASVQEDIMLKKATKEVLSIVEDKKETLRIHDRISLPSDKQPIEKIVWKDATIKNITSKVEEGAVKVCGEISIFIIYCPPDVTRIQWAEQSIAFDGTIDAIEANEDMISYITGDINNINITPVMDQDNIVKDLEIDGLLKVHIKLFEEKQLSVLEDAYKPGVKLVPILEDKIYEKLLVRNQAKISDNIRVKIPEEKGNVLQLCNASARVIIENVSISADCLKVMGKIKIGIVYISSNDLEPICYQVKEWNFEHKIDARGIEVDDKYYLNWYVEGVSSNVVGSNEIEVKPLVVLETLVLKEENDAFVSTIKEEEIDMEALNNAPLLKGYVVKKGDSLWTLAKNNFTTIKDIMEINEMDSEEIREGDKLLIRKSCQ